MNPYLAEVWMFRSSVSTLNPSRSHEHILYRNFDFTPGPNDPSQFRKTLSKGYRSPPACSRIIAWQCSHTPILHFSRESRGIFGATLARCFGQSIHRSSPNSAIGGWSVPSKKWETLDPNVCDQNKWPDDAKCKENTGDNGKCEEKQTKSENRKMKTMDDSQRIKSRMQYSSLSGANVMKDRLRSLNRSMKLSLWLWMRVILWGNRNKRLRVGHRDRINSLWNLGRTLRTIQSEFETSFKFSVTKKYFSPNSRPKIESFATEILEVRGNFWLFQGRFTLLQEVGKQSLWRETLQVISLLRSSIVLVLSVTLREKDSNESVLEAIAHSLVSVPPVVIDSKRLQDDSSLHQRIRFSRQMLNWCFSCCKLPNSSAIIFNPICHGTLSSRHWRKICMFCVTHQMIQFRTEMFTLINGHIGNTLIVCDSQSLHSPEVLLLQLNTARQQRLSSSFLEGVGSLTVRHPMLRPTQQLRSDRVVRSPQPGIRF